MSFPRYLEYKESGLLWFKSIPSHWHICQFKWLIARNDGGVWGDDPTGENDTIVLRSTEQTIDGHWAIEDPAYRQLDDREKKSATLRADDLLITKSSGSALHIGKTTLVTNEVALLDCCYSNFTQRIRVNDKFLPKLAWYFLNSSLSRLQFDYLSNSTTGLANLNSTMIGQVFLPSMPLDEQGSIIKFLDHQTAKFDHLISKQRALIELLKEKRQAVISHAVTNGLNPDVKMKDSGVKWLGQIPEHWGISQSRRLFKERNEKAQIGERQLTASQKYGVIYQDDFMAIEGQKVVQVIHGADILKHAEPDDFVISMRSFQGGIEWCGYSGSISSAYVMLTPVKGVYSRFFKYLFKSNPYVQALQSTTNLVRDGQALRFSNFSLVDLPLIPEEEQEAISNYLDEILSKYDALVAQANRHIELLTERRSVLISDAITGQIDVRNVAIERKAA